MQLDRTQIPIRERGILEIMDLALRIVWSGAGKLLLMLCIGAVPLALLNWWLLSGILVYNKATMSLYSFWMIVLIVVESAVATAPLTIYLGDWVFGNQPTAGRVIGVWLKSLPQLLFIQVFLRGLLLPWVFTWLVIFASWPYASEIILLERTPFFDRGQHRIGTFSRMKALHSGEFGSLMARWLIATLFGVLLLISGWFSLDFVLSLFVGEEFWVPWKDTENVKPAFCIYMLPIVMWVVIGYLAVVRFLSYLDLRIRREGWEVDLLIRAETERMSRSLT